ncbi:MAG: hypothetical protein COC14_00870 [Burkholderiaceae bacterium]|uniref:Uncharacterized protein n=1 Tax=Cupriavidus metallidurans TaxID=119219 RepID=A0A482J4H7_9BURK|nr:MAG: hypothetical protein COC14_00870 [Burkholderiaceae bacterium]QBP13914.1 hypothetical protein DDF84_030725 [Cupriavidus metallidurans]
MQASRPRSPDFAGVFFALFLSIQIDWSQIQPNPVLPDSPFPDNTESPLGISLSSAQKNLMHHKMMFPERFAQG